MKRVIAVILTLGVVRMILSASRGADLGAFESSNDVGRVSLPGSAQSDAGTGRPRIVHRVKDHFDASNWSPGSKEIAFVSCRLCCEDAD